MNNKNIINSYLKSYEANDQEKINIFLHDEHVYYPPGGYTSCNLSERIKDEAIFFSAFRVVKVNIAEQIEEGNKFACRIMMTCQHIGEYQSIPATDRIITISYMNFIEMKDGKIYKEWAEHDTALITARLK